MTFPPSEFPELFLCASSHNLSSLHPQHTDGSSFPQTAAIGVPGEITASSILVTYWDSNVSCERVVPHEQQLIVKNQFDHMPIYITIVILFVIGVNFLGASYFGEGKNRVHVRVEIDLLTGS